MKKIIFLFFILSLAACYTSCGQKNIDSNGKTTASQNTAKSQQNDIEDQRLENVSAVKRPKGKMSYEVDGKLVTIDENMVQCMFIGMNSTMAQCAINGGNKMAIAYMGLPKIGDVEIKKIAGQPNVNLRVNIDGIDYFNSFGSGQLKLSITKLKPDGKNTYVGGIFSGVLYTTDGKKSITVTNGVFESAYL
jgi:hypothetical protein